MPGLFQGARHEVRYHDCVAEGKIIADGGTRLDKWLWCARLFKTRSLAAAAIRSGKVLVAERRVKPSRPVREGEQLTVRKGPYTWRLQVAGPAGTRQSAAAAAQMYREHEDSMQQRELVRRCLADAAPVVPTRKGRPSKKERRDLSRFSSRGP